MTKNSRDWLLVISLSILPIVFLGVVLSGNMLGFAFLFLLGGTVGIPLGLTSSAPNYAGDFGLYFAIALFTALALASFGLYHQKNIWGKILVIVGIYLWCFSGFMALSLSY